MSSDLLAEFDSFYNPSSKPNAPSNSTPVSHDLSFLSNTNQQSQNGQGGTQWQSQPSQPSGDIWGGMTSFQSNTNSTQANAGQDDIWGSFEAAIEPVKPSTQSFAPPASNYGAFTTANQGQQNPGIVRRPTLDLFSHSDYHDSFTSISSSKPQPQPPIQAAPLRFSPGDVLFDAAEELEDDDDFGDFETVTSPEPPPPKPQVPVQTQPPQSLDLMFGATTLESKPTKRPNSLSPTNLNSGGLPYPQAPKSPSFQERNPFGSIGLSTNPVTAVKKEEKTKTASPITAWPSFEPPAIEMYRDSPVLDNQPDDDWGDFADLPPETPAKPTPKPTSGIQADAWAWDAADQVTSPPETTTAPPPPSNIPPPSVLLTLFPPALRPPPHHTLHHPLNPTLPPQKPHPLRPLHPNLPTRLPPPRNPMKIGPSGGKGGMKLAGVDKAEVLREEREAADVVRVWREQIGRLRSAVAVANSSIKDGGSHLDIPEISENMPVRVQEGGLVAPKQCVVCGLKREERVAKVDVRVEDSFGEWWVEHWGHRACRNFWLEHEAKLRHR
ncbi:hypothetical protein LARI1_G000345 [Lachnellula arida]|uniref:Serine/threonine-protein kinase ppk6 n=1 Tax=Lachnellula arida TaxID=1316785 RepID=A0A8T9BP99_9HELO|nr:hypothetical protein LARI1_G000345 [Lachnellula arida]